MTTPVSATTARVRAYQAECQEIGKKLIADYLDANGQLDLTGDNLKNVLTILEYSLEISKECKAWVDSGSQYETWKEMYFRANACEQYMSIDKTGRLNEISQELTAFTDLEEFFELDIKPLDMSNIDLAISAQEMVIAAIKNGNL